MTVREEVFGDWAGNGRTAYSAAANSRGLDFIVLMWFEPVSLGEID
jgi:hypothetical protein